MTNSHSNFSPSSQISVVIPTFNRGAQIAATLDSVLAQTLAPLEIIVVDDGSSDETASFIERHYGDRVRLIRQKNGGVARARNRGLADAKGDWIAFLDHDDEFLPQKLELQMAALRAHPAANTAYCDWLSVDENGAPMPQRLQLTQQSWWKPAQGRVYPWILMPHLSQFLRNPIFSMSFPLFHTQTLRDLGGFDEKMVPSDDWDLLIRLAQNGEFVFVPQVLAHYVHHEAQQHMNLETAYVSWLKLCLKHPVSARRHPVVYAKQRLFMRLCRALLCFYEAERAVEKKRKMAFAGALVGAAFWRFDTLAYRRWHKLLARAARGRNQ